jgi:trehalose-phosphatase
VLKDLGEARPLSRALIPGLRGPLAGLRALPRLLVFDFDGTLAHLSRRPDEARLSARARRALTSLLGRPDTVVAVLSGRSLEDLRRLLPPGVVLLGNHGLRGSRPGLGLDGAALAPYRAAVQGRLAAMRRLARSVPGALVELKYCDLALHYRGVAPVAVPGLLSAAKALFRGSGLRRKEGKMVLEFGPPLGQGKAGGLRRLAIRLAPGWRRGGCALFVGDDRTDEDAFRAACALCPRFLTIKVGQGASVAQWRLIERAGVDDLLEALAAGGAH